MDNELAVLGAALLLAGLFARVGRRLGLPTIPFFIVAGIVFGPQTPGVVVLEDPDAIHLLAMLGLVLLLFHLGIEFSINDLLGGGRRLLWAGGSYIALNFGAGLVLGWALGWGTREIFVIAGMIGTSSTAIVTKLIIRPAPGRQSRDGDVPRHHRRRGRLPRVLPRAPAADPR